MRFATFHHNDALGYGPVTGDEVRPVQGALRDAYPTLRQAIAADALAEIAAAAASFPAIALAEVALAPPIPDPGKIICVGLNYRAHGDRDGRPDFPAIFTRFADTQIGHGAPLRQSTESATLDFEAELAVAALECATNPLTRRELDVLRIAAGGARSTEIADELFLSVGTVRNHLSRIMCKTGARNRLDAVRIASDCGWL